MHARQDFLEDGLSHEGPEHGVEHHFLHRVQPRLKGDQDARGMGAVENADLSRAIGCQLVGPDDVQPRLVEWQSTRRTGPSITHK